MSRKNWAVVLLTLALMVLTGAAFVNYEALTEAYGAGPPYYSRTTNMDKWSDPLPELIAGDAIALLVAGLLFRAGIRRIQAHQQ